jgi:hypothetical protein
MILKISSFTSFITQIETLKLKIMKKLITTVALAVITTGAFAQDLTSKKGEQILPEAEDWSIGVDATPFLDYMGNFFGKSSSNSAPTFNFLNSSQQLIMGKYFVDPQTAYRVGLRIGFGGATQRNMVANRFSAPTLTSSTYPAADPLVENEWKHSQTNIGLAVGMEKRKGKTRLQGYYGGEVGIWLGSSKDKFTYGNALNPSSASTSSSNPVVVVDPSDDNFSAGSNITNAVNITGMNPGSYARVTERKNGSTFSFGLRGFIGVEYFVLPKISLGGEFGWGLGLTSNGKTTTTYESIGNTGGTADDQVGTTTIEGSKRGNWELDTDNINALFGPSGSLRLNFHF